jgi:gliding motility-associated-like protein
LVLEIISPNTFPIGTGFLWTGDNGFQSNATEPVIASASFSDAGSYQLVISLGNCQSAPAFVEVVVNSIPETPTIVTNAPICDGEALLLSTSTQCSKYIWIGPAGSSTSTLSNPLLMTTSNVTIIPATDTAYLAGMWSVICVDGCNSQLSAPIEVVIHPIPADPIPGNSGPVCEGASVQLFAGTSNPPTATYIWYDADPAGGNATIISSEINPTLNNLSANASPYHYWQQVTINGCVSEAVPTTVTIFSNPIANPTNSVENCGDELMLFANPDPVDTGNDYSYYWMGPGGNYFSAEANPIIPNLDNSNLGTYTVIVTNVNGCVSEPAFTQLDTIFELTPPTISLSGNSPVCEGESIELLSEFYNGLNVSYVWTIVSNTTTTISTSEPYLMIDAAVDSLHDGIYYVQVIVDGCMSAPSSLVGIEVLEGPGSPPIYAEDVCVGDVLQLGTDFIPGAIYSWSGPFGFTSTIHNPVIPTTTTAQSGEYILIVEVNGCSSAPVSLNITVAEITEIPVVSNSSPVCDNDSILLMVENPVAGAQYEWFDLETETSVGIGDTLVLSNLNADNSGFYYVVMTLGACSLNPLGGGNNSAFTEVFITAITWATANAGNDQMICEDFTFLDATLVPLDTMITLELSPGIWTVLNNTGAEIAVETDSITLVEGLSPGENLFTWTITNEICGIFEVDTVLVMYDPGPVAADDSYNIAFADSLTGFSVTDNDVIMISDPIITISIPVSIGTLVQNSDGTFSYYPPMGFSGTVQFNYTICSTACPEICTSAIVTIEVGPDLDCPIPNIITPSGDGMNDALIIPCAEEFPGSELVVFNRWGDEIFRTDNYQNDWEGTYKGKELPVGTYFYIFVANNASGTTQQGYIYVQRN